MIKDLFTKKVLAVICAATLSVGSVAVAFATSDYGFANANPSSSSSATSAPTDEPEEPTSEEPSSEEPSSEEPTSEEPTVTPSEQPSPSGQPSGEPSEGPTNPVEDNTYQILGTLVGTWDMGAGVYMTQSKDDANVYTATILGVKPGDYEYAVVMNDNWETKFCGSKGFTNDPNFANLKCVVKEECDVVVTLNLKDMTLKTSVDEEIPVQEDLSAATVKLAKSKVTYNGAVQAPVVSSVVLGAKTLVAGTDYEVEDVTAKNAGTYTVLVNGIGNYKGQACATYTINKKSLKTATATVGTKTFTGKKVTSSKYSVKIKLNGKTLTLKKGTDYTVSAVSRTSAGSSTVTFKGKGNFTSAVTAKFKVLPKSIRSAKVTVTSSKAYTGKKVSTTVKVKVGSKTLKSGRDYKVTYSNNKKIGKATVKITGKGNYTGTVTKTFKIVPAKVTLKSVYNVKGNKVKVTFRGVKGATSYKVSYKVKGAKKWTTKTTKKTTLVLSKLKKNKTYQIKVTASAKSGKTTYTGSDSSVKSVKIKK